MSCDGKVEGGSWRYRSKALVITSMTLLTPKRLFWMLGSALAMLGLGIAGTGLVVH